VYVCVCVHVCVYVIFECVYGDSQLRDLASEPPALDIPGDIHTFIHTYIQPPMIHPERAKQANSHTYIHTYIQPPMLEPERAKQANTLFTFIFTIEFLVRIMSEGAYYTRNGYFQVRCTYLYMYL
jgi:hypothetical protein